MQRPSIPINETGLYSGMGLDVDQIDGVTRVAKTGGTANYYARIVLLPDSGLGMVVLANSFDIGMGDQFDASRMASQLGCSTETCRRWFSLLSAATMRP